MTEIAACHRSNRPPPLPPLSPLRAHSPPPSLAGSEPDSDLDLDVDLDLDAHEVGLAPCQDDAVESRPASPLPPEAYTSTDATHSHLADFRPISRRHNNSNAEFLGCRLTPPTSAGAAADSPAPPPELTDSAPLAASTAALPQSATTLPLRLHPLDNAPDDSVHGASNFSQVSLRIAQVRLAASPFRRPPECCLLMAPSNASHRHGNRLPLATRPSRSLPIASSSSHHHLIIISSSHHHLIIAPPRLLLLASFLAASSPSSSPPCSPPHLAVRQGDGAARGEAARRRLRALAHRLAPHLLRQGARWRRVRGHLRRRRRRGEAQYGAVDRRRGHVASPLPGALSGHFGGDACA